MKIAPCLAQRDLEHATIATVHFVMHCFNACAACAALPCAFVPIVPGSEYKVQVSTLSLTTYILLSILFHLLLIIGYVYSSNVSFLPYNARLML